jgi:hypothetical protein
MDDDQKKKKTKLRGLSPPANIPTERPSQTCIARVFSRDSPGKSAQWFARSIRESWGVLWLVIRLLSERADVSSSVIKASERLYCIPLHTSQHAGALPTTTLTSPTPRRRTVPSKYSSYKTLSSFDIARALSSLLIQNSRHLRTRQLVKLCVSSLHCFYLRGTIGIDCPAKF